MPTLPALVPTHLAIFFAESEEACGFEDVAEMIRALVTERDALQADVTALARKLQHVLADLKRVQAAR